MAHWIILDAENSLPFGEKFSFFTVVYHKTYHTVAEAMLLTVFS